MGAPLTGGLPFGALPNMAGVLRVVPPWVDAKHGGPVVVLGTNLAPTQARTLAILGRAHAILGARLALPQPLAPPRPPNLLAPPPPFGRPPPPP
eukprot:5075108-Prymnesium_polylepis.1